VTVPQFEDAFERADAINATLEGVVVCQPTLYDFMGFVLKYQKGPSKCGHAYNLSLVNGGTYHSFDRCYAGKGSSIKVIVDDRVPPDFVVPVLRDKSAMSDQLRRYVDLSWTPPRPPDPNGYTSNYPAFLGDKPVGSGAVTNPGDPSYISGKINDWLAYGDPPRTYQTISERRREWEAIQESERRMEELVQRVREMPKKPAPEPEMGKSWIEAFLKGVKPKGK
jgi:hypothetical protein